MWVTLGINWLIAAERGLPAALAFAAVLLFLQSRTPRG
jgi:hypothetical protein